jgi:hypothetical protein
MNTSPMPFNGMIWGDSEFNMAFSNIPIGSAGDDLSSVLSCSISEILSTSIITATSV